MRLDADLLRWFRQPRCYQTRINAILRDYIPTEERKKPLSFRVRSQPRSGEDERGICSSPEAIPTRVERTLLSVAFDFAVASTPPARRR
jgi:BrnA antitoxin of type II toxin-antitoxin system